ncbi:hypothetical protein [Microbulbifer pacificus]|uniref:hypothetical protein n=1 Tax=Microbulbifer pacificus TaxID=407164 RepID=UPI00131A2035|nr:hypothetical protein [Microbulbifer pacificus]
MNELTEQEIRKQLLNVQLEKEKNLIKAQEIVVNHLEEKIIIGESATVAAMADILKS